jgi:type I restriction enzyme S subunit
MTKNTARLAEVADFINGRAFKPSDWSRTGVPIIRIQNLTGTNEAFNYFEGPTDEQFVVRKNDILISWSASLGVYRWHGSDAILNQHIFKVKLKNGVDPNYFFYAATNALQEMIARVHGSTMQHITKGRFDSIEILLPHMSKQTSIAQQLDKAAHLRRIRRYALQMSDELLPVAFLELIGDPQVNPKRFPIVELGDFLSFVTSGSRGWAEFYVPQGARFIRSLDVRMNSISDENAVFVNPPQNAEAQRTRVKSGDVLLTITGSQIGRVAPVLEREEGAFISQHVAILRLKPDVLPEFLSMYLSLEAGGQREIARVQYGQTKPGLNLDQIREFRIPMPPLSVQKHFIEVVRRHDRLRAIQREASRQADHLFQTLLHQAFSPQ